ncbi:MAG: hypothetical protein HY905_00230 [Deltaproteobacteria bacterium]|nr:hypothetical protein [Deltaproteobacteria bacterium]
MKTNYAVSARRHWSDAEYLLGAPQTPDLLRSPNADQLYGFAAECALKAALLGTHPVVQRADGSIDPKELRIHINVFWPQYHVRIAGRRARHLVVAWRGRENPFADWTTDLRYAANEDLPKGDAVGMHRRAAKACLGVLERVAG